MKTLTLKEFIAVHSLMVAQQYNENNPATEGCKVCKTPCEEIYCTDCMREFSS